MCHAKLRHNISFDIFSMWQKIEDKNTTVDSEKAMKRKSRKKAMRDARTMANKFLVYYYLFRLVVGISGGVVVVPRIIIKTVSMSAKVATDDYYYFNADLRMSRIC